MRESTKAPDRDAARRWRRPTAVVAALCFIGFLAVSAPRIGPVDAQDSSPEVWDQTVGGDATVGPDSDSRSTADWSVGTPPPAPVPTEMPAPAQAAVSPGTAAPPPTAPPSPAAAASSRAGATPFTDCFQETSNPATPARRATGADGDRAGACVQAEPGLSLTIARTKDPDDSVLFGSIAADGRPSSASAVAATPDADGASYVVVGAVEISVSGASWTGGAGTCTFTLGAGTSDLDASALSWQRAGASDGYRSFAESTSCILSGTTSATYTYDYRLRVPYSTQPGSFNATITYSIMG